MPQNIINFALELSGGQFLARAPAGGIVLDAFLCISRIFVAVAELTLATVWVVFECCSHPPPPGGGG